MYGCGVSVIAGLDYWTDITLCTVNDNDVMTVHHFDVRVADYSPVVWLCTNGEFENGLEGCRETATPK